MTLLEQEWVSLQPVTISLFFNQIGSPSPIYFVPSGTYGLYTLPPTSSVFQCCNAHLAQNPSPRSFLSSSAIHFHVVSSLPYLKYPSGININVCLGVVVPSLWRESTATPSPWREGTAIPSPGGGYDTTHRFC